MYKFAGPTAHGVSYPPPLALCLLFLITKVMIFYTAQAGAAYEAASLGRHPSAAKRSEFPRRASDNSQEPQWRAGGKLSKDKKQCKATEVVFS